MDIIIENVRCFYDENIIPISPITLLVGENSTGKSTFLSVLAAMASKDFPFTFGFNSPPYDLGNYDNIATRKSTNGPPATSFKIGFNTVGGDKESGRTAIATCREHLGQVMLSDFRINTPKGTIELIAQQEVIRGFVEYRTIKTKEKAVFQFATKMPIQPLMKATDLALVLFVEWLKSAKDPEEARNITSEQLTLAQSGNFPFKNVFSIAPIRTKPRRTYDQFNEEFKPEGDHVPLKLARILEAEEADEESRETVKGAMHRFGQESGLFERIEIERLGKEPSSPFRVAVYLGGLAQNLIDVGYGVSQSLPIIVQSLLSSKDGMLIMQQPEVHLHPKAQAALGTFFANLAKTQRLWFAIETHSDYLVDRVRQEVAKGTVPHEDVTILFFEKKNGQSKIYPIGLDKEGNILNAPEGYRNFFLEEELNLLSRGQS